LLLYNKGQFLATEVRAKKNGDKSTITGYAARYNVLSSDLGGFHERIAPGAFKRILATNPDVVCLFNHSDNAVLGRTTAGTLRLCEDSRGLKFECNLPNTQVGLDTYESVQRGDLSGCSFGFVVDDNRMCEYKEEEIDEEDGDGFRGKFKRAMKAVIRTIKDFASLIDVSIVTHPAYPQTCVDARHLLVGAEVRSRVQEVRMTTEKLRMRMNEPSFEDRIEEAKQLSVRNRRLSILDL
jgi:Escherichia/Staphylococcus phage prohead protease